jgi:hypothetical protein
VVEQGDLVGEGEGREVGEAEEEEDYGEEGEGGGGGFERARVRLVWGEGGLVRVLKGGRDGEGGETN